MPTVRTSDGAEIFYEVRGTGPINLALIHGWGGVGGLWSSTARNLDSRQFSSWLIDLRGHGRSPAPTAGFEWEHFGQDILAVADGEGVETFIPVGFSLGGKLALYLTAKCRDRIPRAVLVSPVGPGPAPFSLESRRELARRGDDWRQWKAAIRDWFGTAASEATIDACCRALARTPASILEITAEKLLSTSLPEGLNRTDLPTLVVMGERDPHYGPEYQRQSVLPYLSRAETAMLPAGHFAPLEHPAELARLISRFAGTHDKLPL